MAAPRSLSLVAVSAMAVAASFALAGCAVPVRNSVSPMALFDGVRRAESERDASSAELERALVDRDPALRIAALRALARIGAPGSASGAVRLLGDPDARVAAWAAFALGEIGDAEAQTGLLVAQKSHLSAAPERVLLALGRSGTASVAAALRVDLEAPEASVRGAAAIALGLVYKRHPRAFDPAGLAALTLVREDADANVRFGVAYALMRAGTTSAAMALASMIRDGEAEVRANVARGLGFADPAPLEPLVKDSDWRVQVEAIRSLAKVGPKHRARALDILKIAVSNAQGVLTKASNPVERGRAMHPVLATVEAAVAFREDGAALLKGLESIKLDEPPRGDGATSDTARLACAVALALDQIEGVVRRIRGCGDTSIAAWRRESMAAQLYAKRADVRAIAALTAMSDSRDPRVRVAAVEALGTIPPGAPTFSASVDALRAFLRAEDLHLVASAAEAVVRPEVPRDPSLLVELEAALDRSLGDRDPSFVVGILDAIGSLGADARTLSPKLDWLDQDPRPAVRRRAARARNAIAGGSTGFRGAPRGDFGPSTLQHTGAIGLRFETARGRIEVELDGALAPETAGSLSALAASGFYDGRTFHRIVSDFVAQGGCPRGDGWGGPGYTLYDEVSPEPFVRGAVGIATNGRDTGGSQFFFMHAHHPHLDGAYARVGRVTAGQDVVDALQVDDRILEVRPVDGSAPVSSVR